VPWLLAHWSEPGGHVVSTDNFSRRKQGEISEANLSTGCWAAQPGPKRMYLGLALRPKPNPLDLGTPPIFCILLGDAKSKRFGSWKEQTSGF